MRIYYKFTPDKMELFRFRKMDFSREELQWMRRAIIAHIRCNHVSGLYVGDYLGPRREHLDYAAVAACDEMLKK